MAAPGDVTITGCLCLFPLQSRQMKHTGREAVGLGALSHVYLANLVTSQQCIHCWFPGQAQMQPARLHTEDQFAPQPRGLSVILCFLLLGGHSSLRPGHPFTESL